MKTLGHIMSATMIAAAISHVTTADAGLRKLPVPATVDVALAAERPDDRRPTYREAPFNLGAEGFAGLAGQGVIVLTYEAFRSGDPSHDLISVIFAGGGGRYLACVHGDSGAYMFQSSWRVRDRKVRRQTVPVIQVGRSPEGMAKMDPMTALYDGGTGRIALYYYWPRTRTWWGHRFGHIQERIPAAVYGMCPDFPSAQSLGLRVNDAQTSPNYHDLVKQDPGRRVKRPDLVMAPER